MVRGIAAVPVMIILMIMAFLVASGTARPLATAYWPCVAAPGSRRLWWRRCHTVPPAVVPSAAEGGTLVRHEQLKWWLPAAPMIYERIFTLFASIYNI